MLSNYRALLLLPLVLALVACDSAPDTRPRVVQLYDKSCISCHQRGIANAPVTGDERWQQLLDEKGMDTLVQHVMEGFRGMPPRGQCFDCQEQDFQALIRYMAEGDTGEPSPGVPSAGGQ